MTLNFGRALNVNLHKPTKLDYTKLAELRLTYTVCKSESIPSPPFPERPRAPLRTPGNHPLLCLGGVAKVGQDGSK